MLPGDGLGEPISDGLALLGTAYELAALSQLETALQQVPSAARDLAQAVLSLGAARAFRCAAALRPPSMMESRQSRGRSDLALLR